MATEANKRVYTLAKKWTSQLVAPLKIFVDLYSEINMLCSEISVSI